MKKALVAFAFLACNDRSAKPDPIVAPTEPTTTASVAQPTIASVAPTTPASAAPTTTGTVTPPEKLPQQTKTCKSDDDCTLTSYQSGCCVHACATYATNAARLAEIEAKENCAAVRPTKICPPPAPCPQQKQLAKKAVCRNASCEVVY